MRKFSTLHIMCFSTVVAGSGNACGHSQTPAVDGTAASANPAVASAGPASGAGNSAAAGRSGATTAAFGAASAGTSGSGTAVSGESAAVMAAAGMGNVGAAASAASTAPTYSRVFSDVFMATGCAAGGACHASAQGPSKLGLRDMAEGYTALVGVKAMGMPIPADMAMASAPVCSGMDIERVKAGDPDHSLLVQKLEHTQKCGLEMPPGGSIKPELVKLVRDWIAAGAKND